MEEQLRRKDGKLIMDFGEYGTYQLEKVLICSGPSNYFVDIESGFYKVKRMDRKNKVGEETYHNVLHLVKKEHDKGKVNEQYFLIPGKDKGEVHYAMGEIRKIFKRNKGGVIKNPQIVKARSMNWKFRNVKIPVITIK